MSTMDVDTIWDPAGENTIIHDALPWPRSDGRISISEVASHTGTCLFKDLDTIGFRPVRTAYVKQWFRPQKILV